MRFGTPSSPSGSTTTPSRRRFASGRRGRGRRRSTPCARSPASPRTTASRRRSRVARYSRRGLRQPHARRHVARRQLAPAQRARRSRDTRREPRPRRRSSRRRDRRGAGTLRRKAPRGSIGTPRRAGAARRRSRAARSSSARARASRRSGPRTRAAPGAAAARRPRPPRALVRLGPALGHREVDAVGVGLEQGHAARGEFAAHQAEHLAAAAGDLVGGVDVGEPRESAAGGQVAVGRVHHQLHGGRHRLVRVALGGSRRRVPAPRAFAASRRSTSRSTSASIAPRWSRAGPMR